jgi:hypothetical protein
LINRSFFGGIEEFRQLTQLLVILLIEAIFDYLLDEVKNILNISLFPDFIRLLIKGEELVGLDNNFSCFSFMDGIEAQNLISK